MKIAIASGKGGTGKTTIAVNLAVVASSMGRSVQLLDCDVEEPNAHIFMRPSISRREVVNTPIPKLIEGRCTGCGECGNVCQFSAIVCINKKVLTFPELCHSCGGCFLVCPENALAEEQRELGVLEAGKSNSVAFGHGLLRVSEAISPPLIRRVKRLAKNESLTILDVPPGTSCPVIEAVKDSDFVVLVTEPTPFGLNDLKLAVGLAREMELRHGVVINRCDVGDDRVVKYCREEHVSLLVEIPDDRRIAEAYSRGELLVEMLPEYRAKFETLLSKVEELAR